MTDPEVQRMVLALVYQMEALVDELHEKGVIDRDAVRARVESLVTKANQVADEAMDIQASEGEGGGA